MLRFFVNFFLFGLLFFIIHRYLPDTFNTLVVWIDHIFDFLAHIVLWAVDKIQMIFHSTQTATPAVK